MADVLGCWRITDAAGGSLDHGFFAGPVRLLDHPGAKLRDLEPQSTSFGVVPLGPVPASAVYDTALVTGSWDFAAPDTVRLGLSMMLIGQTLTFRARGDSMVGMRQGWGDVVASTADTATDVVQRVRAVRVACPRDERRHRAVSRPH